MAGGSHSGVCDYCNYNSSGVVLHVGGNYNQNQNHGAFYLNGNNAASNSNSNIGSRHLEMDISKIYWALIPRTCGENYVDKGRTSTPEKGEGKYRQAKRRTKKSEKGEPESLKREANEESREDIYKDHFRREFEGGYTDRGQKPQMDQISG